MRHASGTSVNVAAVAIMSRGDFPFEDSVAAGPAPATAPRPDVR